MDFVLSSLSNFQHTIIQFFTDQTIVFPVLYSLLFLLYLTEYTKKIPTSEGEMYEVSLKETLINIALLLLTWLFVYGSYHVTSIPIQFVFPVLLPILIIQSFIDLKYMELADEWNLLLGFSVLFFLFTFYPQSWIFDGAIATVILFVVFFAAWFFTDGLGLGDVKFIAAAGWLIGTWNILSYLLIALSTAVLFAFVILIQNFIKTKKWTMKEHFPFGPHLILAFIIQLTYTL